MRINSFFQSAAVPKIFWSVIILIFLALKAGCQELTLYVIPPKGTINWKSPQSLLLSYAHNDLVKSKYPQFPHPIGHVIVELKDDTRYTIAGMVAKSRSEMASMVSRDGYGLGILFAEIDGVLREGKENLDDLMKRYPNGDAGFIKFKLSQAAFSKLWQYLEEYKQYGYDKIYNGENKPREGKGAGCSAFAVSFIDIAGLLPQEEINKWQVQVNIPGKLIGGPGSNNRRVRLSEILVKRKWADTGKQPYKAVRFYEPGLMFNWIASKWNKMDGNTQFVYQKEQIENAKGIVIDCTEYELPDEPVWINKDKDMALSPGTSASHDSAIENSVADTWNEKQLNALDRIDALSVGLQQSRFFKNIDPETFVSELKDRIKNPYKLNQGKTVFCWLAAPLAYFYDKDPEGMAEAVFSLYTSGRFRYFNGKEHLSFSPSENVRKATGSEIFSNEKDPLTGKPVDQMLFLSFADHYKCWINIDRHFNPGDQNKSAWGGGALGKEAKLWSDFGYRVKKHGHNITWYKPNKAKLVNEALKKNEAIVLYVNAPHFNQNRQRIRATRRKPPYIRTATHYILVTKFEKKDNKCSLVFWDDDGVQHYTIPHKLFQRTVYGVATVSGPGHFKN